MLINVTAKKKTVINGTTSADVINLNTKFGNANMSNGKAVMYFGSDEIDNKGCLAGDIDIINVLNRSSENFRFELDGNSLQMYLGTAEFSLAAGDNNIEMDNGLRITGSN